MDWNMPPVPPQHFGRAGGNPNIVPVEEDYQRGNSGAYRGNELDGIEDLLQGAQLNGNKTGKNKNKNKQTDKSLDHDDDKKEKKPPKPVEIRYEGYALSKLNPQRGEKPTWSKVGKRLLPVDSDALYAKALQHQKSTGLDVLGLFQHLSADQQGIITRLIAEKNLREKDVNADWILFDVKKLEKNVEVSFWRMGRTVTALRVIIKRQDKLPSSSKKPNTAADYEFGEIIDLSVPLKIPKEGKDGKDAKDGNNNSKDKKKTKKGNIASDLDDDILAGIINDTPYADQIRQNHHAHQQQYPVDPFAGQGQQYQDQHHQQHQQQQPQYQEFHQPQHHHQNEPHHPDPFANVPPGAIPVPLDHQQPQYDHIPPHAPMAPHTNPFQPEVPGVAEQWNMPPQIHQTYPHQESAYGTARISTRERSRSRELERQLEREREENDRLRAASRNRREHEAEERIARSLSRQRRESDARRKQEAEIRRLQNDVASVKDKVHHWQGSAEDSSATSGGDREEFWDRPRSPRYSTPGTSPDRAPRRGSLHRRKSSDPRNTKYYQDRRSSRYPQEPVDIFPEYTHRRGHREYERGRRQASDVGFSPPPRPRITQAQSYDDYPRSGMRYVEPRYIPGPRRLTDYPEAYVDADFDRRDRGVGVDYLRQEPRRSSKQYDRYDREPLYEERRGGGGRRASTMYF